MPRVLTRQICGFIFFFLSIKASPVKTLACFIIGFQNCVQYGKNECQCSYSCKFANEYYEDSKELSEEQRKLLNSSWAAKRKISAEEREKRKKEELEAQKEMWIRIQEEMEKEKEREALEAAEKEKDAVKDANESGKDILGEKKQVQIEAA